MTIDEARGWILSHPSVETYVNLGGLFPVVQWRFDYEGQRYGNNLVFPNETLKEIHNQESALALALTEARHTWEQLEAGAKEQTDGTTSN